MDASSTCASRPVSRPVGTPELGLELQQRLEQHSGAFSLAKAQSSRMIARLVRNNAEEVGLRKQSTENKVSKKPLAGAWKVLDRIREHVARQAQAGAEPIASEKPKQPQRQSPCSDVPVQQNPVHGARSRDAALQQQEAVPVCCDRVVPVCIRTKGWATMDRTRRFVASADLASQVPATVPQRRAGKLPMGACEPLPISGTRIDVELLVKSVREQENMHNSSQYMVQALPARYRDLLAEKDAAPLPQLHLDDVNTLFTLDEGVE